ncbi:Txe/YoeB family addiction module toxin [Limosilactobacillus caecicola]|uniref:Txe/YoeB family addiction module toxin n=1 Tax=Limosilactobacillus caecicola TaxID=2941332 RepID=UPI002040F69B|nr:Txe/YoeB family addiction module toxin [Limosilactobacillus caecicola]
MVVYSIKLKKGAKKDLKKIKGTYLEQSLLDVIAQLRQDPYAPNQSFEKLVPPVKGYYSRRINVQHRVVYKIDDSNNTVVIYSAWSHYQ